MVPVLLPPLSGGLITFQSFANMWKHIPHIFDVNIWNFEKNVATMGVDVFKHSFDLRRFNTAGSKPWVPGKKKFNIHGGNPVGSLVDTGGLRDSINYRIRRDRKVHRIHFRADPNFDCIRGERYEPDNVRSILYAATHNEGIYPMPQRQFMPVRGSESTVFNEKAVALESLIFENIPATRIR